MKCLIQILFMIMFMHVRSEGRIFTHVMELQMNHGNIKRAFLKKLRDKTDINIVLFLDICPGKKGRKFCLHLGG